MKFQNFKMLILLALIVALASSVSATIYKVDGDAPGAETGDSWTDAFTHLQEALDTVTSGDEIWVAEGIYYPDTGSGHTNGNRDETFQLVQGVEVYGGFDPTTGDDLWSERDWVGNVTTLNGDLDKDDTGGLTDSSRDENCYHVVTCIRVDTFTTSTTVLDGFTITGGNSHGEGGGMYNEYSSPTVSNCIFTGNKSFGFGGGMGNVFSSPIVTKCIFSENLSYHSNGGGMGNRESSCPIVTDCVFYDNEARRDGGGIYTRQFCNPVLVNCLFAENSTQLSRAGAMRAKQQTNTTILNCTFYGHTGATRAAHISHDSAVTITNSILWDGGTEIRIDGVSTVSVNYCDVWGGYIGTANASSDPGFANTGDLDGIDGRFMTADDGLRLGSTSGPCDNTGNNGPVTVSYDIAGLPRIIYDTVDMGAYEYYSYIVYVDKDATAGDKDGYTWADAFIYLQDGLDNAVAGSQIWVAEGTYFPDDGDLVTEDNRSETFQLISGVEIYGGFDPTTGDDLWGERDLVGNETILSGDIKTVDLNTDNSYHVVTGTGTNSTAMLDGFTVTDGHANGSSPDDSGAGMINYLSGDPTVNNCKFTGNDAFDNGGAMYNKGASPTVTNCNFSQNTTTGSTGDGGAVYNKGGSAPEFTTCWFINNTSADSGGAIGNTDSSTPTFTSCMIVDNIATDDGGGTFNKDPGTVVEYNNCTFAGNSAGNLGGAVFCKESCEVVITNCILWGDSATTGNEIRNKTGNATITVTYSDVQGGHAGIGNVDIDPKFVNPDTGDYHLQQPGVLNVVDGGASGDYRNQNDIDLDARLMRTDVDMGADEIDWPCDGLQLDGDADGDGIVEFNISGIATDDYDKWLASYNTGTYNVCCDFNRDGTVDEADRTIGITNNCDIGSSCTNCQGVW